MNVSRGVRSRNMRSERVEANIVKGASVSDQRRPLRTRFEWHTPLDPAGVASYNVNIANVNSLQAQYTAAGISTQIKGYHYPYYMSPDGKLDSIYTAIIQRLWIQFDPRINDDMLAKLLSTPSTLEIKIGTTHQYWARIDELAAGGNRFQAGTFYRANAAATPNTVVEPFATTTGYGNQDSTGGISALYVNKDIPGIRLLPNTELVINLIFYNGWSAATFAPPTAPAIFGAGNFPWLAVKAETILTAPY